MSDQVPPVVDQSWSLPILKDSGHLPEEVTDSAWINWLIYNELPLDVDVATIDNKYHYLGPCGWARMIKEQLLRDNEFKKNMSKARQVLFDAAKRSMTNDLKEIYSRRGKYAEGDCGTNKSGPGREPASTGASRKPDDRNTPSASHRTWNPSTRQYEKNHNSDLRSSNHSATKLSTTRTRSKRKADEELRNPRLGTGGGGSIGKRQSQRVAGHAQRDYAKETYQSVDEMDAKFMRHF
ncbi:hypothetical protein EDC01DRAFT_632230 [Geopyxis carbonaria]|nr:hypothetical protein EDC01DRAFT_632230 [Geopyxis carbonaria]